LLNFFSTHILEMQAVDSNPLMEILMSLFKIAVVVLLIVNAFYIFNKKSGKKLPDIKTRMLRKFQFANYELLPQLTNEEKQEMVQVLQNTIINAELFKKENYKQDNSLKTQRPVKNPIKKVHFQF